MVWFRTNAFLLLLLISFLTLDIVFGTSGSTVSPNALSVSATSWFLNVKLPADDPFYTPPPNFQNASLGSILRHRPIPNNLTLDNVHPIFPKAAWQLLYRTQNSVGEPSASIVTVIAPFHAKKDHLFSYAMFSDSAYNGCNPSVTLQVGTRDDNTFNQLQNGILVQALALGFYVTVADYGGLQAAFSSGLQAGYATLDSLRAVMRSGAITGIDPKPITTLLGYSSGGQAVGWATELHPTYAPELEIAGAALGGIVPNLTALLNLPSYRNGSRSFAGPPTILGISHDYKNLSKWLDDSLVPSLASTYRSGDDACISGLAKFENQDQSQYFKQGLAAFDDPVLTSVLRATGTMGLRGTPKIPWYLYHAVGDDVSPVELTDRLYHTHCANNANILYERNPIPLTHRYECIYGLAGAYKWLADRHKRKDIVKGCSLVKVSNDSLIGAAQNLLIRGIISSIWAYFGWAIGPEETWWDKLQNSWDDFVANITPQKAARLGKLFNLGVNRTVTAATTTTTASRGRISSTRRTAA